MSELLNKGIIIPTFPTEIKAENAQHEDYIHAFNTMIQLRNAKGAQKVFNDNQWFIAFKPVDNNFKLELVRIKAIESKLGTFSPAYATKQHAQDAINEIGVWAIEKMFKTFAGI